MFENLVRFAVIIKLRNGKKEIKTMLKRWPTLKESEYNGEDNYAILTGKVNDIIVVDLDKNKERGTWESVDWFESKFGRIMDQRTLVTRTPSGGCVQLNIYYTLLFKLIKIE